MFIIARSIINLQINKKSLHLQNKRSFTNLNLKKPSLLSLLLRKSFLLNKKPRTSLVCIRQDNVNYEPAIRLLIIDRSGIMLGEFLNRPTCEQSECFQ